MKLWIFKALLLFCHCSVTLQQMVCSAVIFGRPIPHDCSVAIEGIKGAKDATSPEILVQRYFAEPQFMDPPFGALAPNPFNNDIVQMPKIWRFREFTFFSNQLMGDAATSEMKQLMVQAMTRNVPRCTYVFFRKRDNRETGDYLLVERHSCRCSLLGQGMLDRASRLGRCQHCKVR